MIKEITRENASFASKTIKAKEPPPLTLDIDFQDPGRVAALIDVQRQVPPGFYGLTWGQQPQRPMDKFDQKLDKFYDCDTRLVRRGRRVGPRLPPPRLSTARAPTCQSPP